MVLAHTHCFEHACQQGQPASVAGCQWKQILIDSCDPRLTTMPGISHQSKMVNLEPNAKHVQLPLAPVWLELPIKTWPCAAGIVLSLLPSQGTTFVGTGLNEEKRELTTRLDVCHSYCHWRAKGLCSLPHPRTPTAGGWSGEMVPSGASSAGWTAAGWRSGSGSPGKQGRFPSHQVCVPDWLQAKSVNFATAGLCNPREGLLTLLKRDEKTSWWSFMFIPSHIFSNSSSSSILNSSNVSHWISRSSSSMSLKYYSTHFHWRALHWFSDNYFSSNGFYFFASQTQLVHAGSAQLYLIYRESNAISVSFLELNIPLCILNT